jgi:hypothetical protein
MPRRTKGQQAPYHVRKTTLLPSSLREELVASGKLAGSGSANSGGVTKSTSVIGRKQRRQQERKQGKGQSHQTQTLNQIGVARAKASQPQLPVTNRKGKQRAQDLGENTATNEPGKSKKRKRVSFGEPEQQQEDDKNTYVQKRKISSEQSTPLQRLLEKTQASGSNGAGPSSRSKSFTAPSGPRTAGEQQEDEEIAWLEAKLGIRKNPNARKELQEDGLDGG